jgi:hypothetical protein
MGIVFAGAGSHAPGIRAWADAAEKEAKENFYSAYDQLNKSFDNSGAEVLITLTSEHWTNFFLDHSSAFCIGRAEQYSGPVEPWLGIEPRKIPGNPELSKEIISQCYLNEFEVGFSEELKFDHGTMIPLSFVTPNFDVPIVPIFFNTLMDPRPSARRCFKLGQAIGALLNEKSQKIGVIATGGLSHDPGEIGHGEINSDFDNTFLNNLSSNNQEQLIAYTDDELFSQGGGTPEILAWICLAGIMTNQQGRVASVLSYEAIKPWATGVAVVEYV